MIASGTVLDPDEDPGSVRVREAVGPWRVVSWHTAYQHGGAEAVDAKPGGRVWRTALEALAPDGERHLLTFEGHVTDLPDRDRELLEYIDVNAMVGDAPDVGRQLARLAEGGFQEIIYTPSGPDVARELRAFASVRGQG
jgi:5,10-methylenetetrahydromethanopterin reductase